MIVTSEVYKEEIRALYDRKIYGRVQIDYSDPEIDQGSSVNANDNNYTSYPNQLLDGKGEPNFKYLSLDGSWVLGDNTYGIAPSNKEVLTGIQMGLWGSKLSNNDGTFTSPRPKIIVEFIAKPIRSLKLVGDIKRNEFPIDFNVKLYREDDELVYTETVIDNTNVSWDKPIEQINEIVKMEIEILKWNVPNKVVKIVEVFSSIQEIYEGEDIISIKLLEERDISQSSLPVGNISSNEIGVKLSNIDRKFDSGNKDSNLYGLVKPNRRIKAWVGTESELIPLGVYWTKDWDVPEDGVIASTVGRDRLDRLSSTQYSTSKVEINKNMYELAEMVLNDGGISSEYYWLDDELKNYVVPYAYFESQSHREALRKIAGACMGQVYCDRDGIIRFEGVSFTTNRTLTSPITSFLQAEFPSEIEIIDAYGISDDDYFTKNNPSRQSDISNRVVVETQPLRLYPIEEIYTTNEPISIGANESKTIIIQYNNIPCIDINVNISGVGNIINSNIYAWGAEITVNSTISGTFNLVVNGKPLKVSNKDKVIAEDEMSIIDNGVVEYKVPINPLIQTREIAQQIAETLLFYYKDPKRDLEIDWRGNPALTLGDIVMVDDYTRGSRENKGYYYIVKNELEFAGYLRARLEGRRAL